MARKNKVRFVCQACGHDESKWFGRCPACDAWNTATEELVESLSTTGSHRRKSPGPPVQLVRLPEVSSDPLPRLGTGYSEFDRTLGGGLVPGSVTLLGGEPGIGKSTLLIQALSHIAEHSGTALYITGEESVGQVKLRAARLGLQPNELYVLAETNAEVMVEQILQLRPFVVAVDSIQSAFREEIPSAPGTVSQVRECAALLLRVAKQENVPLVLVGHVTKEGFLAGPRVLEHMVDTVLQVEGDRHGSFRLLRAVKNRFGSTSEIGLFEMQERGLHEVPNPEAIFLGQNYGRTPGSAVSVSLEGTRPLLLEIQALACPGSGFGAPRRNTSGIDPQRLAMLLAVLEKRNRIPLASQDVYVNIVGGVRVSETAIDLGVCMAVASSFQGKSLQRQTVVIGEVGLSGEIRAVRGMDRRLAEARNLGFSRCLIPEPSLKQLAPSGRNEMEVLGLRNVQECLEFFSLC